MPLEVRRIGADEGRALRAIRLRALQDAPSAFGSTFAAESPQPDAHWDDRARRSSAGRDSVTFLAREGADEIGLVAAYRPEPGSPVIELVSMWTAPEVRRAGCARRLVDAVLDWARDVDAEAVELWVTVGNDPALALYRAAGFVETGARQALPSDPSLDEVRLRHRLRVGRDDVARWVEAYERAWRAADTGAVADLFSEDAAYRASPYEAPSVGHEAIRSFWAGDAGRRFAVEARPVAVDGDTAVVRVDVAYETPRQQEYRDLWILRFAPDGRVAEFEEWAYWPGRPYSAGGDPD